MEMKVKKEKLNKIITIILVGLLLLIIVVPVGDGGKDADTGEKSSYEEAKVSMDGASYYEERLKLILEKSYGVGTMEVMVHMKETDGQGGIYEESTLLVDGILIVADVKDDADIGNISFAVCSLFDLPAHKVAVIKK